MNRKRRKKMNCNPANPKEGGLVDVWHEANPVRFNAIDKSDKLTLHAMFQFFQEAAISHAENLGCGREAMAQSGQAWILSRMTVQADRRPAYCENVTIGTWPQGVEKLFVMRNYTISGRDEKPAVSARSAWLIVDLEKRRPLRPQFIMDSMPKNEGLDTLPPETSCNGLQERNSLSVITKRKANYTDIDYFGHVNNVKYIEWIEDALDPQLLEKAEKMRFDINYLNEILSGETIQILSAPIENGAFAFEGRKEDGKAAFRAELLLF